MNPKLTNAFCQAKCAPETDLAEKCWCEIALLDKRNTRIKLWVFSAVGLLAFVGLVPAVRILSSDFTQSGSYDYFSLIFSDSTSLLSYWEEFSLSLAESLPLPSIILSLSLVFILFFSIKHASKQIIKNKLSLSF